MTWGGIIKPVVIDSFWYRRINEAIIFIALSIFALYMWLSFFSPHPLSYNIQLTTFALAIAAGAASVISRVIVDVKGTFIRTLLSYLLLVAAIVFLLYDTGGLNSPYVSIWVLVAACAGLFGVWGSIPVFLTAAGYLAVLLINDSIDQANITPVVLTVALPIIFSIVMWSHVNKPSYRKKKRDPTAYGQLSEELSELSSESSEVVINAIGDAILALDSQGIIRLINPAALSLLGWVKRDVLTLHYQSVLKLSGEDDKQLPDAAEPIKQALNTTQEVRTNNLQVETKSGKKKFISLVVSPLGLAGSGVIVVFRDITKEHAAEREQAEFISTASHEMRTPVASIEGYLGLALNPSTATIDDKARDYIAKAHESAQHLGRLFQDLLDISKSEDGRLSNNPVAIDIVDFTGGVVDGLQPQAAEKGLQLSFKPAPSSSERTGERRLSPVYYVKADKDHVREIINNLTENAIKYTHEGEVSVDITGDNEHITISVTDSGIGIPAEDISHLFQKFYRVDNSDTREIGGSGLGLYLCRRLAEAIGGRVWAESVYRKGSTFYLQLPRIDNVQAKRLLEEQAKNEPEQPHATPTPTPTPAPQPIPSQPAPLPTPALALQPAAPQPAPIPNVTPPQPQPQPQPQPAPQPQPQHVQPAPPARENTPLSSIEQNPAAYMVARNGRIVIPPRNQH